MSAETEGSSSSDQGGVLSPSLSSGPPASSGTECGASRQQLKAGTSTLGGMMATNISLCCVGHDGDTSTCSGGCSTSISAGRSSGSSIQPASFEEDIRRAKFASALHLSKSNGGKSPRSPSHSSLSIDISSLPPMHISSEDADDDSSSKESDNDEERPAASPHAPSDDGKSISDMDCRRGGRVHRVLAEAASSPSLGSIDDNDRGASPRSFNLQPRPNRHSPSPNESASANPSLSSATNASVERSFDSTCTRPPSSFGRISPHLHLDLSCVAVPPLNATSSNFGQRCRSDSEATLGSNEVHAASTTAGMRQPTQQIGSARPSIEPPPWAVAAKGEARMEVSCQLHNIIKNHLFYMSFGILTDSPPPSSARIHSRFANLSAFKVPSILRVRRAFELAGHRHPTSSCCMPLLAGDTLCYFTTPTAVATWSTAEVLMALLSMAKG